MQFKVIIAAVASMAFTGAFAGPVDSIIAREENADQSAQVGQTQQSAQVQQDHQSQQGAQSAQGKQDSQFGLPGGFGFPDIRFPDTIVVNQPPPGGFPGQFDPRIGGPCDPYLGCGQFGPQPFNRFAPQFGCGFMQCNSPFCQGWQFGTCQAPGVFNCPCSYGF
ncbi:hypothetical protein HII31_12634 [Pseudocercospora fuligena]|uniref:Carbohydrate-binding module family 18 protein n=1 Tax=Pseudocercospora fuligena TaxID=685502 RepID=A0A8H6R7N7_9PEZI|nr:hypothetical protein HII31_12634 [Pseudocercospora fuligena]